MSYEKTPYDFIEKFVKDRNKWSKEVKINDDLSMVIYKDFCFNSNYTEINIAIRKNGVLFCDVFNDRYYDTDHVIRNITESLLKEMITKFINSFDVNGWCNNLYICPFGAEEPFLAQCINKETNQNIVYMCEVNGHNIDDFEVHQTRRYSYYSHKGITTDDNLEIISWQHLPKTKGEKT